MKWTCTIIQNNNGRYTARMMMDQKEVNNLPINVDYKTLKMDILNKTGVILLKRKSLFFERISDAEKIATIDATQYLGEGKDCRVTLEDRINGWSPCWD